MTIAIISCEKDKFQQKPELIGKWKTDTYCGEKVSYDCQWQFDYNGSFELNLITPASSVNSVGTFKMKDDTIFFDCSYYGKDFTEIISLTEKELSVRFYVGGVYKFVRIQ